MKLKKVIPVKDVIKEDSILYNFMEAIPNYLGINLCAVKDVEMEAEDDEFGQLTKLSINFIPTHDEKDLEGVICNGGPWPWLTKDEDGVKVIND